MNKRACDNKIKSSGVTNKIASQRAWRMVLYYIMCVGLAITGSYDRIDARNRDGGDGESRVTVPAELAMGQEDVGLTRAGKRRQRREQARAKKRLREHRDYEEYEAGTEEISDISDIDSDIDGDDEPCRKRTSWFRWRRKKSREKTADLQKRTDELQAMMLVNPAERNAAGFVRTPEENRELARELSECAQELRKKGFAINMVHIEAKVKELMQEPGTMNAIARDYADQMEEWKKAYSDKVQEIHQREIVALEQSQHIQTLEQQREELIQEKEQITAECARSIEELRKNVQDVTTAKEASEQQVQNLRDQVQTLEQTAAEYKKEQEEKQVAAISAQEEKEITEEKEVKTVKEGEVPEEKEIIPEEPIEISRQVSETPAQEEPAETEVPQVGVVTVPAQAGIEEQKEAAKEVGEEKEGAESMVGETETAVTLPTSEKATSEKATSEKTVEEKAAEEVKEEAAPAAEQVALAAQKKLTKNRRQQGKVVVYAAP